MDFNKIRDLIDVISQKHAYTKEIWDNKINLKKKTISNLVGSSILDNMILSYIQLLNENFIDLMFDFSSVELDATIVKRDCRIKDQESALFKIQTYMGKSDCGNYPVIKCFNDLLGFRIVIDTDLSIEELVESFNDVYPNYKCIDSSKNDYKAIHVYFTSQNNHLFPWELQIWRACDYDNNIKSHEIYKREYTKWKESYNRKI